MSSMPGMGHTCQDKTNLRIAVARTRLSIAHEWCSVLTVYNLYSFSVLGHFGRRWRTKVLNRVVVRTDRMVE